MNNRMRGRTQQSRRAVQSISPEQLGKVYDRYAAEFLERLAKTFGNKMTAAEISGLTLENARKISPNQANARNVLQKVIEEKLYDSGPHLMQEEKYWEILKGLYDGMEKELSMMVEQKALSPKLQQEAMEKALSEVIIRSERVRIGKMLGIHGVESAWGRFLQIIREVASNHDILMDSAEFDRAVREAAMKTREHTHFFLEVLGVAENDRALCKELLTELNMSDSLYADAVAPAKGYKNSLLTPKERSLLNMSLESKLFPEQVGLFSGEETAFNLFQKGHFEKAARAASTKAVADLAVASEKMRSALRKAFAPKKAAAAKASVPKKSGARAPAMKKGAAPRAKGGFGKLAAGIAIGAFAYHMIINREEISKKARELRNSLKSTPKKEQGKFEGEFRKALKKIAPFSSNTKAIAKMLNSLKVNGRKLTEKEKLRALRVAALRKNYKGKEMERFVKIAAILQFTPKQSDANIAMLSEEIKELVPPQQQEKTARDEVKKYSGEKPKSSGGSPSTQKKKMAKEFRDGLERLRKKIQ